MYFMQALRIRKMTIIKKKEKKIVERKEWKNLSV